MESGIGESTSVPSQTQYFSGNSNNDAGDFECNICFDLAQDPIVTLCGHLFCWPCLYKWLQYHAQSHECPVCKALVQENKLVPLYGRGKSQIDPRSKLYPDIDIPDRPAGQRPETARQPELNPFSNGFDFVGGFAPMTALSFGNFALLAAFGGLLPSIFSIQIHGFQSRPLHGASSSVHNDFGHTFGGNADNFYQPTSQGRQTQHLRNLFFLIGFLVILALIW